MIEACGQPTPSTTLWTDGFKGKLRVECRMNPGGVSGGPFPILYIGWNLTLYPTMEHLEQIRDTISMFLEAQKSGAPTPIADAILKASL